MEWKAGGRGSAVWTRQKVQAPATERIRDLAPSALEWMRRTRIQQNPVDLLDETEALMRRTRIQQNPVDLLDETEALKLVEFVMLTGTLDPPIVIHSFPDKQFISLSL